MKHHGVDEYVNEKVCCRSYFGHLGHYHMSPMGHRWRGTKGIAGSRENVYAVHRGSIIPWGEQPGEERDVSLAMSAQPPFKLRSIIKPGNW